MKKIFAVLIILIFLYTIKSVEISEKPVETEESQPDEEDIVIEDEDDSTEQDEQKRSEKLQKLKLQEYQGECEEGAKLCLPFTKLSFADKVWGSKTPNEYLADLNEFVQENFIFKKEVEFEIDQQRNLKAVLKEDVELGDTLAAYFNQDEVYQSDSLGRIFFHSYDQVDAHLDLMRKLLFKEADDINRDRLRLAVVLLYHLYHIEHSKYAADLRLFPRTISNPMITLTMYELDKFLKFDKMIYKSVIQKRKEVMEQYEKVNTELQNQLSPEEITSFLDGRENIPLDDFVYIISIIDQKGIATTHEKLQNQVFWFIQPVINHLGFGENFVKAERQLRFHFTGKDLYSSRIFFNRDIQTGFQIKIDFLEHRSQIFFLNNAIVPRFNDLDCVHLRLIEPELVEVFKLQDNLCLNEDHMYIEHYHSIAIILNMDEVEKDLCTQTIKKYNLKDPLENKKIFNRKCEFKSGFKKYDFWKDPLAKLKATSAEYHTLFEALDEYIKLRSQYGKSIDNAILMTQYLSNRQSVVNKIRNKIKEMIKESLKKKEPMSDPRPDFKMKNQDVDEDIEHVEL